MKLRDRLSDEYKSAAIELQHVDDNGRRASQYVPYRWKTEEEWQKDWWFIKNGQQPKHNVQPYKKKGDK